MSNRMRHRPPRGFTLTELLVAMAVTGLVSLAIFAMMNQTSDAMKAAESSASALDSARFAMDQVKGMIQNAGAQASVDTFDDPMARPRPHHVDQGGEPEHIKGQKVQNSSCKDISGDETLLPIRVSGLVSYGSDGSAPYWQDYASEVMASDIESANPKAEFDGIVVMGAYDYPIQFEVSGVLPTSNNSGCPMTDAVVPATMKGTYRLANPNPFDTTVPTGTVDVPTDALEASDDYRMLRISDHAGHNQFSRICSADVNSDDELELGLSRLLHFKSGGDDEIGLEQCSQQASDITYDASLIDAYWLRVRQDPDDSANYQLVRERLNANTLATAMTDNQDSSEKKWRGLDPSSHTAGGDPVVLANRVVDFQIWFSCTEDGSSSGTVESAEWNRKWTPPNWNSSDGFRNCLHPGDPDPGRARMAHVRLSMRSADERTDLKHVPFPPGSKNQMQTFDVDPNATGAARVVTFQQDIELPNYSIRNVKDSNDSS